MAPRRHFLGSDRPALIAAVDYLRATFAKHDQLDLSRVVVVLPGRRAGRRLLELLSDFDQTAYLDVRPPRIITFDRLPELLYPLQRPAADDLTQLLIWWGAITSFPAAELSAVLPHPPRPDALNAWLAICESLQRQHTELAGEGLDFSDVLKTLQSIGETSETKRWACLRRIQQAYLARMDECGRWDLQTARVQAVRRGECFTDQSIVLLATTDMNGVMRSMLKAVERQVSVLIHADPDKAELFDEFGCVRPDRWQSREIVIPDDAIRIVGNPEDQADRVLRELRARLPLRADDVTIGVADESLHPVLRQKLAAGEVAVNLPVGRTSAKSRPWQLLDAVCRHLGSAREDQPPGFATLNDLVRHPDLFGWITEKIRAVPVSDSDQWVSDISPVLWLNQLDAYCADHLQAAPGVMLGSGQRRRVVEAVCVAVERWLLLLLDNAVPETPPPLTADAPKRQGQLDFEQGTEAPPGSLRRLTEIRRTPAEWAAGMMRLLHAVYAETQATELSDEAAGGIVLCVSGLRDLHDRLQEISVELQPRCTVMQALQFLLGRIEDTTLPPEWQECGVELMGWLDLPLDDAPFLILTGFNDGSVPATTGGDTFLPDRVRQLLGLNDNQRRYARDACALEAVLTGRQTILIMGRSDADGNPLAPSRLWFACDPRSAVQRIGRFYDSAPDDPGAAAGGDDLSEESLPSTGFEIPAPAAETPQPKVLAVTAFRDYLQCPYRYFLRRELNLQFVPDDVRELDAACFGNLIHDVLNAFGQSSVRDALDSDAILEFLIEELQRIARLQFGRSRSATVSVQLRMVEARLTAFARWQAAHAAEGWRILKTEQKVQSPGFRDLQGRELILEGRIDRIDRQMESGEHLVLDYKTSEQPSTPEKTHRSNGVWRDLQLPLYRLLVRALGIRGTVRLGYVLLPGDSGQTGLAMADWTDGDLDAAEEMARGTASDILNLKIPSIDALNDLRYAELSRICMDSVVDRTPHWLRSWRGRHSD